MPDTSNSAQATKSRQRGRYMMEGSNETKDDIIAEMKRRKEKLEDAVFAAPLCYSTETMRAQSEILDEFIERFEAAHKREKATAEKSSAVGDCAKLHEDLGSLECQVKPLSLDEAISHADEVAGDCSTSCKREHKQLADWLRELKNRRNGSGDCAKLREALTKVEEWMERRIVTCGFEFSATIPTMLEDVVLPALAAPPRNCDMPNDRVEKYDAFKDWCNARGHTMEPKLAYDAFEWLLSPATEKEGGGDGKHP